LAKSNQELQGLYQPDQSPVFPDGMAISAHNPAAARKQRVKTPHLTIIELVLDQLPHVGTAGQLLYLSLIQNYATDSSKLHHELIFFDVGNGLDAHNMKMSQAVKELQKR
jgi:hypothetical protein